MLDHCKYQMKLKANIHDFVLNFLYENRFIHFSVINEAFWTIKHVLPLMLNIKM